MVIFKQKIVKNKWDWFDEQIIKISMSILTDSINYYLYWLQDFCIIIKSKIKLFQS